MTTIIYATPPEVRCYVCQPERVADVSYGICARHALDWIEHEDAKGEGNVDSIHSGDSVQLRMPDWVFASQVVHAAGTPSGNHSLDGSGDLGDHGVIDATGAVLSPARPVARGGGEVLASLRCPECDGPMAYAEGCGLAGWECYQCEIWRAA